MRKLTSDIKRLFCGLGTSAFMLLATVTLAACSMFEDDSDDTTPSSSDTYVQVRLQVAAGSDTRAYGGEEGDGREAGFDNENVINNVTVLLYEGDGISAANANTVKIARAIYFGSVHKVDGENAYKTSPYKLNGLEKKSYHVIAIANMGYIYIDDWEDKTLAEVRDYIVKSAWTSATDISDYDNFVMSSEKDATLTFDAQQTGAGTEENPYTVETTIERIAARIDFDTENGAYQDGGYIYNKVYNSESATESNGGVFVLTHVRPFNELTYGSYLIKRVSSDGQEANISYLGDETKDTNNKATNYVLDALSGDETTRGSGHYTNYYDGTTIPTDGWDAWTVRTADQGTDSKEYYILDYTMENTSLDNSTAYATGLFFKGTLYKAEDVENGAPKTGATGEDKTYVYYIRHSDPDGTGTESDPMHYGIVRNNIYRVKIDKVISPDTPQGGGLKITLNVRKWAVYTHSGIVM